MNSALRYAGLRVLWRGFRIGFTNQKIDFFMTA